MRLLSNALLICGIAIGLAPCGLVAQAKPHTGTLPRAFAGWDAPESNWLPLGRTRSFAQNWYHGANFTAPTPTIKEVGWRIDRDSVSGPTPHNLEITLANTPTGFDQLDQTFAKNLGKSPVVFFKRRDVTFPAVNRPGDVESPSLWLKGDRPFVFLGPHLIVQVDVQTLPSFGYVPNYRTDSFVVQGAIHGRSGKSCGKSRLEAAGGYGVWIVGQSGLPPNTPAILLGGLDHTRLGGLPLPLDLTAFGMKGCALEVAFLFMVVAIADDGGNARWWMPYPTVDGFPVSLHGQGLEIDLTLPRGVALTNAVHSVFAEKHLSNYLFNWSRDGPTAEWGPFSESRGTVLLYR